VDKVAEGIHVDQFEREQRYEIFINKMYQLYKYEKRAIKKQRAGFLKMATAPLMTETPVKLILNEYKNLSSQGSSTWFRPSTAEVRNRAFLQTTLLLNLTQAGVCPRLPKI
jgi:hypothetical protein